MNTHLAAWLSAIGVIVVVALVIWLIVRNARRNRDSPAATGAIVTPPPYTPQSDLAPQPGSVLPPDQAEEQPDTPADPPPVRS